MTATHGACRAQDRRVATHAGQGSTVSVGHSARHRAVLASYTEAGASTGLGRVTIANRSRSPNGASTSTPRAVGRIATHELQFGNVETAWATLRYRKHRDLTHPWEQHDWTDVSALSVAVPYCDVVITERRWAHMIVATGLAKRHGTRAGHGVAALEALFATLA